MLRALCVARDNARIVIAEHISISHEAVIPLSFSSDNSTHGQTRKYVSISFQQRAQSRQDGMQRYIHQGQRRFCKHDFLIVRNICKISIGFKNRLFWQLPLHRRQPFCGQARKAPDKSKLSTLIPWRCIVISSKRTVLKAVVLAPIQPIVKRFHPFTTRQIPAKSCRFCVKFLRKRVHNMRRHYRIGEPHTAQIHL